MSLLRGFPLAEPVDEAQAWLVLKPADATAVKPGGHYLLASIVDTGDAAVEISDPEYVRVTGRRERIVVSEHGYKQRRTDAVVVKRGAAGSTPRAHLAGSELLRYYPDARQALRRGPTALIDVTWT